MCGKGLWEKWARLAKLPKGRTLTQIAGEEFKRASRVSAAQIYALHRAQVPRNDESVLASLESGGRMMTRGPVQISFRGRVRAGRLLFKLGSTHLQLCAQVNSAGYFMALDLCFEVLDYY
jgi:hypothetical protein